MTLTDFYASIPTKEHRTKFQKMMEELELAFPSLELLIKWNQPMFLDHGVFILGFSVSKKHFSISPDKYTLEVFKDQIEEHGYIVKKMLFSVKWEEDISMDLLKSIIEYNIEDRKGSTSFWRP